MSPCVVAAVKAGPGLLAAPGYFTDAALCPSSRRRRRLVGRRWTGARSWRRRRGGIARARRGAMCRSGSGSGTGSTRTSPAGPSRACGRRCWSVCSPWRTSAGSRTGSPPSTPRSCGCTSTARRCRATRGAGSNYTKFAPEPVDHATGRSRGGLTTKTHLFADAGARAGVPAHARPGRGHVRAGRHPRPDQGPWSCRPPPGRDRTGLSRTRATLRARTVPGCANGASPRPSPSATTRSRTAATDQGGPATSAASSSGATRTATSSNAA